MKTVTRWFIYCKEDGEMYDGPFRSHREALVHSPNVTQYEIRAEQVEKNTDRESSWPGTHWLDADKIGD